MLESEARRYWALAQMVKQQSSKDHPAQIRLWMRKLKDPRVLRRCQALLNSLETS